MRLYQFLFILTLCVLQDSAVFASPRLKAGVIVPLTGTLVASGESVKNAILLAKELHDPQGLVEFEFEDDGFQPKNSVSIARKFIAANKDIILIFGTPTAFAVVPVTEAAQMPLAAITIVDKVVKDRQFAVRHFVAWQEENKKIIAEMKVRGYKSAAIVTTINDATISLRDGFLAETPAKVVLNEEFVRDNMDFHSVAARIKSLKPDVVYHLLFAPQGSVFMKALRSAGCEAPVLAVHNVEDPTEVNAASGTYEGIRFATGDDSADRTVEAAYLKRFGSSPAMGWANGFDLAKMIIEAASAGKLPLDYMKQLKNFDGVFGRYGAAPGNSFSINATMKTIKKGRIESAEDAR